MSSGFCATTALTTHARPLFVSRRLSVFFLKTRQRHVAAPGPPSLYRGTPVSAAQSSSGIASS